LPKMAQFMSELEAASDKEDQGLVDKAQFYASAYSAFNELQQHKSDLESVSDRGYIFMGLNNLIAKKPELVNDARIQNFCQSTESAFNQSTVVDFEREKKDFISLLKDAGVEPSDIQFDPNYKTKLSFQMDGSSLTMKGGWLENLIIDDDADKDQEGDQAPPATATE